MDHSIEQAHRSLRFWRVAPAMERLAVADEPTLHRLMATIESRKAANQDKSYTSSLLAGGVAKIARKITEESAEVVEAASEPGADGQAHLVREAADLLYHLLVLLACRDVTWADVEAELARREGVSGLEEKAARGQGHS
jgi:phosphoribosyl-ATP pyrophosphohydrolase